MSVEIKVPVLGESVVEATVAKWMKASGEAVKADEAIVELETDKVTLEVPSPVNGVLSDIVATEGATVGVDALLGLVEEGATSSSASPKAEKLAVPDQVACAPAPQLKCLLWRRQCRCLLLSGSWLTKIILTQKQLWLPARMGV